MRRGETKKEFGSDEFYKEVKEKKRKASALSKKEKSLRETERGKTREKREGGGLTEGLWVLNTRTMTTGKKGQPTGLFGDLKGSGKKESRKQDTHDKD